LSGDVQAEATARVQELYENQADDERCDRSAEKPNQSLQADATDRGRISHVANAAYERRKYEWRNDHLDQAQKDISDNGEIASYRRCNGRIGQELMEYEAHQDAEEKRT
jgi:hypothetical protein